MTNPIAVTGAASGLGAAVSRRVRAEGRTVIGTDVVAAEGVDVIADLSTPAGRDDAVAGILERCDGRLDGLVVAAAIGPESPSSAAIVSINWYGAVYTLERLRPALAAGDGRSAVIIASIGAVLGFDAGLVDVLLTSDEAKARATTVDPVAAYSSTKRAIALAVRRRAGEWAAAGVRLNAVAPGRMTSPMLERIMASLIGPGTELMPSGIQASGTPDEVAGVVHFLLGPDAVFVHGQTIFADGGSDALMRPDVL